MVVDFNQMPQTLCQEFFRVETHRIARTTGPLGQLVQQGQSGNVGDEKVEPPSTRWVTLHPVEEAAVAMLHQCPAELVAASVCSKTLGTPRPYHCPEISGWLVAALRSRNMEGEEVGQQCVAKGGEVGHRAGI